MMAKKTNNKSKHSTRHLHQYSLTVLFLVVVASLMIISVQLPLSSYLFSGRLEFSQQQQRHFSHDNVNNRTNNSKNTSEERSLESSNAKIIIESIIALTGSRQPETPCPTPLVWVKDTILPNPEMAFADNRKIPRIVHISSSSRCNHKIIADNLNTWRLDNHYFFLHTDDAVLQLLHHHHHHHDNSSNNNDSNNDDWRQEFPLLHHIMKCLPPQMGAAWIDVWRLLLLWKYGGIYADMDTSPVPNMFNASTITPQMDAFFVQEQLYV